MSKDVFFTIALIMVLLAVWLFVPSFLVKRAMRTVIKIFRQKNAVGIKNAKTAAELGLAPKPFLQRMMGRRDYKPRALEYLIQYNVVLTTEDGKLYITERSVSSATWLKV